MAGCCGKKKNVSSLKESRAQRDHRKNVLDNFVKSREGIVRKGR